ncbi:glycosyltransferase family 1 protein [Peribacillus sp. NPDC094092]|uniref:glycosyltransferase family 1 protein n=1 Tax=Peribacillus sp. NPDC094092 TaxID=3390611 RepID=UPI003D039DAD
MYKKVKILHYVPGFDHGGIESRLIDWYKNIDRDKIQFDLIKLTPDTENPLIVKFKELGGKVYTLPKFSPKTYFKYQKELKKFFNEHDYNAVHCHSPITGHFVLQRAMKSGIPIRILHSRTTQFNSDSSFIPIRNYLKKLSTIYATDYFACSKEAGTWLFGEKAILDKKVKIIDNGIEAENFIFNNNTRMKLREKLKLNNNFVIGNVGRFSTVKNHSFMIDIFNEICKVNKNSILMLLGDGPTEENIKAKVKELNLVDKVLFLGRQTDVEKYLQAMDVFLFPSQFEGFGTVAIEAQTAGLRCIVSDGVPFSVDVTDLIEHLPLSIGPEKWADNILQYSKGYKRNNMYEEIVRAGFDVKSTIKFLEKFYLSDL